MLNVYKTKAYLAVEHTVLNNINSYLHHEMRTCGSFSCRNSYNSIEGRRRGRKFCLSCNTKWEKGGCYQFFSDLSPKGWYKDLAHLQILLNLVCSKHSLVSSRSLHSAMRAVLQENRASVRQGTSRKNPSINLFQKEVCTTGQGLKAQINLEKRWGL